MVDMVLVNIRRPLTHTIARARTQQEQVIIPVRAALAQTAVAAAAMIRIIVLRRTRVVLQKFPLHPSLRPRIGSNQSNFVNDVELFPFM